jgi:integrase
MTRLSLRTVNAAAPGDRDVFLWDEDLKGFGLKITPSGAKIYVAQGRINGRPKRYTIGRHGSPWTPDLARQEAEDILYAMSKGEDPTEAKRKARKDLSVAELVDLYFAEGCGTKKASTIAVETGLAERHVKPRLGKRMLKSLSRADLEKFLADVAAGKTKANVKTKARGRAIVKGGQGTANRTMDLIASMLAFAVTRELRPDNPARGVRKFKPKVRERFLSPKELADLGTALSAALAEGENRHAVYAIRLLMLTGCRKSEILTLRWDWIDTTHGVLRLPDSKTGSKTVPLGAPALELLAGLPRVDGSSHVFPSTTGKGHLVGIQKIWSCIRAKAGLDEVRLHDLRHSYASVGASGGDSLYVIGKLLGHNQQRTTQRYAHLADDPVRAAADRISKQIAAAMDGVEANIVPMNKSRPKTA